MFYMSQIAENIKFYMPNKEKFSRQCLHCYRLFSEKSFKKGSMDDQESRETRACERLLVAAVDSSPLISLLVGALAGRGCPFSLLRHLVCERCGPGLAGGYDTQTNQIVICSNYSASLRDVRQTLRNPQGGAVAL